MASVLLQEERGEALWLTLNRPDDMNAVTPDLVREVTTAMEAATGRGKHRAVVITGAGRAFCAGADLKFFREVIDRPETGEARQFVEGFIEMTLAIERFPGPVIAAVNGLALAGGLEIVLSCDLVIAARSAKLGDAHANFGLVPGGGSSIRLPRKIGATAALYLLYTGAFVPAEELVACGLVNRVVPDDQLESEVGALVETLAAKSPLSLARMKTLVHDGLAQPLETALRLETSIFDIHSRSKDIQEGLTAFGEKRKPVYRGE